MPLPTNPQELEKRLSKLQSKHPRFFRECLALLNPEATYDTRIISSPINFPYHLDSRGVYEDTNWPERHLARFLGVYRTIDLILGEREADDFGREVYSLCTGLPSLSNEERVMARKIDEKSIQKGDTLPYHVGFAGDRYLREVLLARGFFTKLEEVYPPLHIMVELTTFESNYELTKALQKGDIEGAQQFLQDKLRIGQENDRYSQALPQNRNYYQVLLHHLPRAYQEASRILRGIPLEELRETSRKLGIYGYNIGALTKEAPTADLPI